MAPTATWLHWIERVKSIHQKSVIHQTLRSVLILSSLLYEINRSTQLLSRIMKSHSLSKQSERCTEIELFETTL